VSGDASAIDGHHPREHHPRWKIPLAPRPHAGQSYQDLREQMKTGDLLLFRGNRLLSGVIERLSDSPYSHVAIVARWHDRVVAFQADLRGVEVLPASTMVCKYSGKVDWWALKPELRERSFKEDALFDTALTLLGIKYGYWRLLELGGRILLGRTLNPKDAHATPDSLFCSEFVSRCYRNASGDLLDVNKTANDASTSPADFAASGFFEQRYQLFDGSNGQACTGLLEAAVDRQGRRRALIWDGAKRLPPESERPPRIPPSADQVSG
jgi:hypothetical protein